MATVDHSEMRGFFSFVGNLLAADFAGSAVEEFLGDEQKIPQVKSSSGAGVCLRSSVQRNKIRCAPGWGDGSPVPLQVASSEVAAHHSQVSLCSIVVSQIGRVAFADPEVSDVH